MKPTLRLRIALSAATLLALLLLPQLTPAAPAPRRPNIIFILADDLGWADLGCYGNRQIQTPNLDRLARQGTLFTQFYVDGSVCSPSRTAFMTGHFPARHRVHGHFALPEQNTARGMPQWLDAGVPTVTSLLHKAGYRTAHFGKWHLGNGEGAPEPGAYGFDSYRTINGNGPTWEERDPFFRAKSTGLIVDETIRFIEANRDRPFCVNVWTLVPHAPLNPTDEQMAPYQHLQPGPNVPYKGAPQIYYASVSDLDRQVGRLLDRLDALGLAGNTLVLFSSDNGPEEILVTNASHSGVGSPGPFRGRKRSLYEGGVREPFLVRWPGHVPAGEVDDQSVVTAVDFLPTLCKLAGVTLPSSVSLDGEDIGDILGGKPRPRVKPIMWEWRFNIAGHILNRSPILAIRDGKWKLLLNPDGSRVELYDIPSDPSELDNVADRNREVVQRLSQTVLSWQKTLPPGPRDPGAGRSDYPWPRPAKKP
jgi:N-acetylgalactosamine-6-sulfatase